VTPDQGGPRDWDKELADIDKIIAATPPAKLVPAGGAAPAAAPAKGGGGPAAGGGGGGGGPVQRRDRWATWFRVGLGAALGVAMTQWPYFHACGTALLLYLGAAGVVSLSGLWGAVSAWRRRMGLAHVVALLVFLWGGILVGSVVLPRIGYAKRVATWWCP
jgi:hypothetical protein